MKVLITAAFLGRYGETDGVVTTYTQLLSRFVRAGIKADVVAYGPTDEIIIDGSIRVFVHRPRLALKIDPTRWIDPTFAVGGIARYLSRNKYDLVQSSSPCPLGIWANSVARNQKIPLLALYHTALTEYARIRYQEKIGRTASWAVGTFMEWWIKRYYNQAQLILAPSNATRLDLKKMLRPPVAVLSRGVDSNRFHPGYRSRRDGKTRALYVGRVAPEKNLALLTRIFRNRPNVELMIVGDGPYLEEMRRELPHAIFTGRLTGRDLSRAYADADFFVFPSKTDTLGNVVLEAMSSGLPVVVTDAMGPKELVQPYRTGFIARTDEDFAQAVNRLISSHTLRDKMGREARQEAELRSWDNIFDNLMAYYDLLLEYQTRPGRNISVVARKSYPGLAEIASTNP